MSLVVVGSVALDTVSNQFGAIEEGLGGSAVYFSLAASPFTNVKIVAVVGDDFRQDYIDLLKSKSIDTKGLYRQDGKTFRWIGEYSEDLGVAHTIDTQLNVFESFQPKLPRGYRNVETLFLANIDPDLQLDVLEQVKNPKLVACDTMNFWIEKKREKVLEVLKHVNMLFINEDEAKMLANNNKLLESAAFILSKGPDTVFIKRGGAGVFVVQKDQIHLAPAYCVVQAIDTTGAGDSFAGGCMGYLTKTRDLSFANIKRAAAVGTILASFNIESFSIHRLHLLREDEIQERWVNFKKVTDFNSEPPLFEFKPFKRKKKDK